MNRIGRYGDPCGADPSFLSRAFANATRRKKSGGGEAPRGLPRHEPRTRYSVRPWKRVEQRCWQAPSGSCAPFCINRETPRCSETSGSYRNSWNSPWQRSRRDESVGANRPAPPLLPLIFPSLFLDNRERHGTSLDAVENFLDNPRNVKAKRGRERIAMVGVMKFDHG